MEVFYKQCIYVLHLMTFALCEHLELPAYEYLRRFKQPLHLGQCAHRVKQYPNGIFAEPCTVPSRKGETTTRFKEVDSQIMTVIHSATELIQHVGMCNDNSAVYFGLLLSTEDCLAKDIANKMSFKPRTVVWLYKEHFRPKIVMLNTTSEFIDIPKEFSHYMSNLYYTEHIDIGTEELIIVEMKFKTVNEARTASVDMHNRMSQKLVGIVKHAGRPRKVKVARLSTAENIFETRVFKDELVVIEALQYINTCESNITRIRQELKAGLRNSHLRYGFKSYEIIRPDDEQHVMPSQGPSLTLRSSITIEEKKRENWEDVAVLEIEAKRICTENRKYRKFCLTKTEKDIYCLMLKQTLWTLKQAATKIHAQRREWSQLTFYQQCMFVTKEKQKLKLLKDRMKWLVRGIRLDMKETRM